MKKIKAPFFAAVFTIIIFNCGGKKPESVVEKKAVSVTIAEVELRDIEINALFTGTLEGDKQARIFASIPEAVVELPFKEGNRVKAGDPVILLDKGGAASMHNQAQAVFLEAKDNYDKMSNLYKGGAISEQVFTSAKTGFEVARANFESARQQVELTSPISGILTELAVNIGEYARPGFPLATIAQTRTMRLTLFVDNRSSAYMQKGQNAEIIVEMSGAKFPDFNGIITEVSESADPETRLFRVEISIDNSSGGLKPGMFARARITTINLKSVLTVPKEAVFSVEGVYKIYANENGRAVEKTIAIGESSRDFIEVKTGLQEGESVVVIGRNLVENGSLLNIPEEGKAVSGDDSPQPKEGSEE